MNNICPKCGKPFAEGERFCTDCGFRLGAPEAPAANTNAPTPEMQGNRRVYPSINTAGGFYNPANPNMQPNANPNVNTNMYPNANPNANPNMYPNANPNVNPNMQPNANPNANPNMYPNANPKVNPNMYPNANPNVNPNMYPNANPNTNPNMYPNANPNVNPNIHPNANPNVNPNMYPNANPNMQPNANPNVNPNMYPNANPKVNPNMYPNVNPNMQPNANPNVNPNMYPNPNIPQNVPTDAAPAGYGAPGVPYAEPYGETPPGKAPKKRKKHKIPGILRFLITIIIIGAVLFGLWFGFGNMITLNIHADEVTEIINSGSLDLPGTESAYDELPNYIKDMLGDEYTQKSEHGPIMTEMLPYVSAEKVKVHGFFGASSVEYRITAPDLESWLLELDSSGITSDEALLGMIRDYIPDAPPRSVVVTVEYSRKNIFSVKWKGNYYTREFSDAVCGGVNTAYSQLYKQFMEEILKNTGIQEGAE